VLLNASVAAHIVKSELFLLYKCIRFISNHVVECKNTSSFTEVHDLENVRFCWQFGGSRPANCDILDVNSNLIVPLVHGNDRLNFVHWSQADVSKAEDAIVNNRKFGLTLRNQWVLVGNLTQIVYKDLASFLVKAFCQGSSHVFCRPKEFESPTIDDLVIVVCQFISIRSLSKSLNSYSFQTFNNQRMSRSSKLRKELSSSLTNAHCFLRVCFFKIAGSFNPCSSCTYTENVERCLDFLVAFFDFSFPLFQSTESVTITFPWRHVRSSSYQAEYIVFNCFNRAIYCFNLDLFGGIANFSQFTLFKANSFRIIA